MKSALITGANKSIGFETSRQLAQKGYFVYLGSRDIEKGTAAADILKQEGLTNVEAIAIDVCNKQSIEAAKNTVEAKTKGKANCFSLSWRPGEMNFQS